MTILRQRSVSSSQPPVLPTTTVPDPCSLTQLPSHARAERGSNLGTLLPPLGALRIKMKISAADQLGHHLQKIDPSVSAQCIIAVLDASIRILDYEGIGYSTCVV